MRIQQIILVVLLLASTAFVSGDRVSIEIFYAYGHDGKNKLDTKEGTFTSDMVVDPSITIKLKITDEERKAILAEAQAVNFFELPSQIVPPDTTKYTCVTTPCGSNFLRITVNSRSHAVRWDHCNCNPSAERDRADKVGNLIIKIVGAKDEYKKLPKPRGAYL